MYAFSQKSIFKNTGVILYKEHLLSQMLSALTFKLLPRNIVPPIILLFIWGEQSGTECQREMWL